MAAAIVTVVLHNGAGVPFNSYWYDDGTGTLYPLSVLGDGAGGLINFTAGTAGVPAGPVSSVQFPAGGTPFATFSSGRNYETVAASQTAQVMGGTGATGDVLDGLLVTPASTSPGVVTILDNATSINVFAGGASSTSNLVPFWIALNSIASVSGAWKVTTGANVSVVAVGKFS